MRAALRRLADIRLSIAATFLAAIGAFLSMGVLGLALYAPVSPALGLAFPPLEDWDQSLVWPVLIAAPLLWSLAFVPAGLVNRRLKRAGWRRARRILVYAALLWLAAFLSWCLVLALNESVWR